MSAKKPVKKETVIQVTEKIDESPVKTTPDVKTARIAPVPSAISEEYLVRTLAVLGESDKTVCAMLSQHNLLGALNALIFAKLGEDKQLPVGCGASAIRDMLAVLVEDYNAGK